MTEQTLGDIVRARRKELRLTQATVAERAGTHQVTISRIEGDRFPSPRHELLTGLAQALGMPEDALHAFAVPATRSPRGAIAQRLEEIDQDIDRLHARVEAIMEAVEAAERYRLETHDNPEETAFA